MMLKNQNRRRGQLAEDFAARYLEDCGYRILERNYFFSRNETDIIAEDDTYIIFVEVKARHVTPSSARFGRPAAAVTAAKRARLLASARGYLAAHPSPRRPRLDVLEIYIRDDAPPSRKNAEVKHLKNAFGA